MHDGVIGGVLLGGHLGSMRGRYGSVYTCKNGKIHFSCEIEHKKKSIKAQLCKLRVIVRSRVLRGVYTLRQVYRS